MTSDASANRGRSDWAKVAGYRSSLADDLQTLTPAQWDSPSWCSGWRVRDVLGHLVHLAEASQWSMIRDVLRNGIRPDRAVDLIARQHGDEPTEALVQRLHQGQHGTFVVIGFPPAVALGDVMVHGNDALRALGLEFAVIPADVEPILRNYQRVGGLAFHARPHRKVRLVATDIDWSSGNGREVSGRAIDLLMLMANRRQVIASLSGPGVADLAA
jgi:uncharacterized protein (TIGR03083 family)